ncbi:hypothetical protein K474DRAFT_1656048 [Panus rudis PR-1116 ss-1]|nr:hypothetical protein K474DRAFT_1656048 [Panus rudis PR-1116 ss-1]
MHHQTSAIIPSAPSAPNAFSLFTFSQSPRDAHLMFEDLGHILRPLNGRQGGRKRSNSTPSISSSFKKLLGF